MQSHQDITSMGSFNQRHAEFVTKELRACPLTVNTPREKIEEHFKIAIHAQFLELLQTLLEQCNDLALITRALILAIECNYIEGAGFLLQKNKAYLTSALSYACYLGRPELVAAFLSAGASLGLIHHAPLVLAAENGHLDCVEILLPPLLAMNGSLEHFLNALDKAIDKGHFDVAKMIMERTPVLEQCTDLERLNYLFNNATHKNFTEGMRQHLFGQLKLDILIA
jgi:ankyrin repeat protein